MTNEDPNQPVEEVQSSHTESADTGTANVPENPAAETPSRVRVKTIDLCDKVTEFDGNCRNCPRYDHEVNDSHQVVNGVATVLIDKEFAFAYGIPEYSPIVAESEAKNTSVTEPAADAAPVDYDADELAELAELDELYADDDLEDEDEDEDDIDNTPEAG